MEHIEDIERYLRKEMNDSEALAFESLLAKNNSLTQELEEYKIVFEQFEHAKNAAYVKKQIALVKAQESRNTKNITGKLQLHIKKYWRTASIAATVAFLASTATFFIAENVISEREDRRITELVNDEVEEIKAQQRSMQKDINAVQTNVVPDYPSKGSGTAFAIDRNGYAITNLHVIRGGKKIFLFTKDGKAHKCEVLIRNKENDIAVLKVLDDNFSFSKKQIPYRLDKKAQLAERIFTLGYPKKEIVYNEGYISSLNGKAGDTTKYQLELPSSPGVSGAPVLDKNGNLIGIINSKESRSKGITYAIKSEILHDMLDSLEAPFSGADLKSNSLQNTSRASQIQSLEEFVFVVKVYK